MSPEKPFDVNHRVDCPATPNQDDPDITKPDESFVVPSSRPGLQELIPDVRERLPFSDKGYPKYGPGRGTAENSNEIGGNSDNLNFNG